MCYVSIYYINISDVMLLYILLGTWADIFKPKHDLFQTLTNWFMCQALTTACHNIKVTTYSLRIKCSYLTKKHTNVICGLQKCTMSTFIHVIGLYSLSRYYTPVFPYSCHFKTKKKKMVFGVAIWFHSHKLSSTLNINRCKKNNR